MEGEKAGEIKKKKNKLKQLGESPFSKKAPLSCNGRGVGGEGRAGQ
jgi:hypothetical protein